MDEDDIVCSECLCAACEEVGTGKLCLEGWDLNGEFGPRCSECVKINSIVGDSSISEDGLTEMFKIIEGKETE